MPCYYPARAYRIGDKLGRSLGIVFSVKAGMNVLAELSVPCGKCIGCQLERSRQWAVRCMHEASLYERNCCITLTYNDAHLPDGGDLVYEHFQLFMKRLRRANSGRKIRFFMCGEYGEDRRRPHFHACLFGIDFDDRVYFKTTSSGTGLWTSKTLDGLWSDRSGDCMGFCTISNLDFAAAGYIARYLTKKQSEGSEVYEEIDKETGEVWYREREFVCMSLKPGIGYDWYRKWKKDLFPRDVCVINGVETKPPRYYFVKYREEDPEGHEAICYERSRKAAASAADSTAERLAVREVVHKARVRNLKRELK